MLSILPSPAALEGAVGHTLEDPSLPSNMHVALHTKIVAMLLLAQTWQAAGALVDIPVDVAMSLANTSVSSRLPMTLSARVGWYRSSAYCSTVYTNHQEVSHLVGNDDAAIQSPSAKPRH